MLFKEMSYLQLWQPFCSMERNHLSNFVKGYYEKYFCEIILTFENNDFEKNQQMTKSMKIT